MNKLFKKLLFLLVAMAASMRVSAGTATSFYANFYNGVLTFYHDSQSNSRSGTNYFFQEDWHNYGWLTEQKTTVTKVVFDSSFHDYKASDWSHMFFGLENLTTVEGMENLNLSKAQDMTQLFDGCKSLTTINVSNLDMSHVTNIEYMFRNCQSLEYLDVSNWNVSNIFTMQGLFDGCSKLKRIDVSKWNVSNVTTMISMFRNCMFTVIDLGDWNTSRVTDSQSMFSGCENLTTIFCEHSFSTASILSSPNMFLNCFNLVGERGTKYNPSYVDFTYARIDGGTGNPGYFTSRTIPIDAAHFPDANFRTELKNKEIGYDNKLTIDELFEMEDLDLDYTCEIEDLQGIQYFTELSYLNFCNNHVNKADLSKNTKLRTIYCDQNELNGATMDDFVEHLPSVSNGMLSVYDYLNNHSDHNEMTPEQVAAANQKGWTVKVWDESIGKYGEWSETQGFWQINEERFPDENFRNHLLEGEVFRCTGILTVEDVENYAELDLGAEGIEDLTGIEYFSTLEGLYFPVNYVKTADLSHNTSLTYITCDINQISGANMDFFVNHLPFTNNGIIQVYDGHYSQWPDANEMTPEQVAIANQKGWTVEVWDETQGYDGDWAETQGIWLISEERFPDENFRSYLSSRYPICTGAITYEETMEDEMLPYNMGISDMTGIGLFKGLYTLECNDNQLTTLDLSGLENLSWVSIFNNQIKGTDMDNFIASLRVVPRGDDEGRLYALRDVEGHPEGNEVTEAQVKAAERRGWIVYAFDPSIGNYGGWVEYTGAEPTGITLLTPDTRQPSTIYDMQGVRQTNLKKGLNIVRQADGTTRKVVIK